FSTSSRISLWMAEDVTQVVVMFSSPASAHTDHNRATTSRELSIVKTLPWVTMPEQQGFTESSPSTGSSLGPHLVEVRVGVEAEPRGVRLGVLVDLVPQEKGATGAN